MPAAFVPGAARAWLILASLLGRFLNSGPAHPGGASFQGCSVAEQAMPRFEAQQDRPGQGFLGVPASASGAPSMKVCQANQ
jgi:hypothetical protein